MAPKTDVIALLELLRDAGARILPEVWHRATTRAINQISPGVPNGSPKMTERSPQRARGGTPFADMAATSAAAAASVVKVGRRR